MDFAVTTLLNALTLISILMLVGLGLAISFGLMNVTNLAHGEFVTVGAFAVYFVQSIGGSFWLGLAAAPSPARVVGCILEFAIIRHLYSRPVSTVLATWGVSLILQQGLELTFGLGAKPVTPPIEGTLDLFFTVYPAYRLILIGIAMLTLLGVVLLISRTRFGLDIRTVIQNREMAEGVGINTRRTYAIAFTFGAAIAGLAGGAGRAAGDRAAADGGELSRQRLLRASSSAASGSTRRPGRRQRLRRRADQRAQLPISPSLAQAIVLLAAIVAVRLRPNGLFNGASR